VTKGEKKSDFYRETKIQKCDKKTFFHFFAELSLRSSWSLKKIFFHNKKKQKNEKRSEYEEAAKAFL